MAQRPGDVLTNALSVPAIVCVILDENNPGGRTASVVVMDDQLSLAIGRSIRTECPTRGQTHQRRVDIRRYRGSHLNSSRQVNQTPELLDALKGTATQIPRLASIVRMHEQDQYPYTDEERNIIGTVVKRFGRPSSAAATLTGGPGPGAAMPSKADAERVKAKQEGPRARAQRAYKIPLSELGISKKVHTHLLTNGLENAGELMERMAVGDEALLMLNGIGIRHCADQGRGRADSGLLDYGEVDEAVTPEGELAAEDVPAPAEPTMIDEAVAEDELPATPQRDEEPVEGDG